MSYIYRLIGNINLFLILCTAYILVYCIYMINIILLQGIAVIHHTQQAHITHYSFLTLFIILPLLYSSFVSYDYLYFYNHITNRTINWCDYIILFGYIFISDLYIATVIIAFNFFNLTICLTAPVFLIILI